MECELISEIEFVGEKSQKAEFYIKEMKEKIKRHLIQFKCSPDSFLEDSEIADFSWNVKYDKDVVS